MESALQYKMTIWTGPTYDDVGGRGVLTIEAYFKVALWGSRRENRNNYLPSICIPYFQDWVAEHFGIYVSDSEVNVRFEAEGSAETEDEEITADFRVMTYRGKAISAQPYPQETIPIETGGSEYDPDSEESDLDDEDFDDWEDEESEW
jgi:hypothetical protein